MTVFTSESIVQAPDASKNALGMGPLEIGSSLPAIFSASSQSAAVDQSEICTRNLIVDSILNSNFLCAINVEGDGNYLFRALSVGLYGHEKDRIILRKSIATHMEIMYNSMNPASNIPDEDTLKHIIDTGTDGKLVGKDAILCAANYLRRDIHVYLAAGKSPFIHSPQSGPPTFNALSMAFYEP